MDVDRKRESVPRNAKAETSVSELLSRKSFWLTTATHTQKEKEKSKNHFEKHAIVDSPVTWIDRSKT